MTRLYAPTNASPLNNTMDTFSLLLCIAVIVLIGNLLRLLYCTVKNCRRTDSRKEQFQSIMLFLMYLAITGFFIFFACKSLLFTFQLT